MSKFLISLALSLWANSFVIVVFAQSTESIDHRDAVVKYLEGVMTASIELEDKPIQVQMTTCRVEATDKDDSIVLYQEQGLIDQLDRPYRQRFIEISAQDNVVFARSYKPEDLAVWVNICEGDTAEKIDNDNSLASDNLGQLVCTVTLKPYLSVYVGNTPSEGCPTNARGAVRITNRIILHQAGMDTWDRGFDESGNQVWGAEDRAYQFRRQ